MEFEVVEGGWDMLEAQSANMAKDRDALTERSQFSPAVAQEKRTMEDLPLMAATEGEGKCLTKEPIQSKSEQVIAEASVEETHVLRNELRTSRSEFDHLVLTLLLIVVGLLFYSATPAAALPIVYGSAVGFGAAAWAMLQLKVLDMRGILLLLVNVIVLVPFNILNLLVFVATWPLRMLIYQVLQFLLIPLFSHGKVVKSPSDATFPEFLKVTQGFFDFILFGIDPKLKPFQNIDDATVNQAVTAISHAPLMTSLNRMVQAVPKGLLNSLAFRIIVGMFFVVTIGWWWVGWNYMPLLPLRTCEKQPDHADKADAPVATPPVQIQVTECKWLKVGRESLGESVGRAKCLNE